MLSENEIAELSLEVIIAILRIGAIDGSYTDTLSTLSRDQDICREPSPLVVAVRFSGANGGPNKSCRYIY